MGKTPQQEQLNVMKYNEIFKTEVPLQHLHLPSSNDIIHLPQSKTQPKPSNDLKLTFIECLL